MTLDVPFASRVVLFGSLTMFSMEKCLGSPDDGAGLVAGGEAGAGAEGAASDEVASAVAAVSDEIGDILKDELGDAARADRIDAELADLSAELGLLAGLAEGEPQQDFPSLFEIAVSTIHFPFHTN